MPKQLALFASRFG
ncbi:hypothetical protein ADUPG1_002923, partial [Aduncisulcus paluster]